MRPAPEARIWFWISPWAELIYGKIVIADHRTDNIKGLFKYAAAFANSEELQFGLKFAPNNDAKKRQAVEPELQPERIAARRDEISRLLRAAIHGPSGREDPDFANQSDEFLTAINKQAESKIEWQLSIDRNIGWQLRGIVNECDGFVALITSLLLAKENRQLLGQCGGCSKFIVEESTEGKPRKRYCGDECMHAVNAAGGAARQRDRYKRNRVTELLVAEGHSPAATRSAVKLAFKDAPASSLEQLKDQAKALLRTSRRHK